MAKFEKTPTYFLAEELCEEHEGVLRAQFTVGEVEMVFYHYHGYEGTIEMVTKDFGIHTISDYLPLLIRGKFYKDGVTSVASCPCPPHYKLRFPLVDFIYLNNLSFFQGNFLKYLLRAGIKGSLNEDIDKCLSYLDMIIASEDYTKLCFPADVFSMINGLTGFKSAAMLILNSAVNEDPRWHLEDKRSYLNDLRKLLLNSKE